MPEGLKLEKKVTLSLLITICGMYGAGIWWVSNESFARQKNTDNINRVSLRVERNETEIEKVGDKYHEIDKKLTKITGYVEMNARTLKEIKNDSRNRRQ